MPWKRVIMQLPQAGRGGMNMRAAAQKFRIDVTAHCSLNSIGRYSNIRGMAYVWEEKESISVTIY